VQDDVALIQDDANFVALLDPVSGRARAIPLPAGEDGLRQFDSVRGNKKHKLDLEACVGIDVRGTPTLLAFGSGSTLRRESLAWVRFVGDTPDVRIVALPEFYGALRSESSFAGSEMNVEAAVVVGDCLRLFSRGNGRARDQLRAVNAICDIDLPSFLIHLAGLAPPPAPRNVVAYELGAIDGVRLGFTDAATLNAATLYSAAAESSPDAVDDGAVAGSAIGVIDDTGAARWTTVTEESGERFVGKIEGILIQRSDPLQLLAVIDMDDPSVPSELCTIELAGPWNVDLRLPECAASA
jgi:hypothetical protein